MDEIDINNRSEELMFLDFLEHIVYKNTRALFEQDDSPTINDIEEIYIKAREILAKRGFDVTK